MLKIYITRHGQDEDNAKGILNGHRDKLLTKIGIKQAGELTDKIREAGLVFDTIYSSPLSRAYATSEIVCNSLGFSKPIAIPELIERNFGVMTGKLAKDIESLCGSDIVKTDTITYFLSPASAETFPDLINRAKKLLSIIAEKHSDGSILLVTHGDFGKMLYASYYDLDWKKILTMFHFGNSELILLANDSKAEDAHVFRIQQYNN